MRILIIDHACCDPPDTRPHLLRGRLMESGVEAAVCGPSSVPSLASQPEGMFGIHLHDIAAASRRLHAAVTSGDAGMLLTALAGVSPRLLGLARETARQALAEAVDAFDPDAIFVLHAGILADLAIETGVPVALHVAATDLAAAGGRVRGLVLAALGSCAVVAVDAAATAAAIRRDWADDAALMEGPWIAGPDTAPQVLAACQAAVMSRRL
jgi:hypothetical protein